MNNKIETILDDHKESILHVIAHNLKHEQSFFLPEKAIAAFAKKMLEPKGIEVQDIQCSPAGVKALFSSSVKGISLAITVQLEVKHFSCDNKKMKAEIPLVDISGNNVQSKLANWLSAAIAGSLGTSPVEFLINNAKIKGLTSSADIIYYEQENIPIPEFLKITGAEHHAEGIMLRF